MAFALSIAIIFSINVYVLECTAIGNIVNRHGHHQTDIGRQDKKLTVINGNSLDTISSNDDALIDGSNEFGFNLMSALLPLYKDKSIWISPPCIAFCFGLVYPGSGGKTKSQIANVMGYPTGAGFDVTKQFFQLQSRIQETYNGKGKNSVIAIANKIYVANRLTLQPLYVDALNDGKKSFIESIDFGSNNAVKTINNWVSDNTQGFIPSIMDYIPGDTQMLALNAIYLKGTWRHQFKKEDTSLAPFYFDALRSNKVSDCHLMHQTKKFEYYQDGNHQFLKIRFSDSFADLYALFALPMTNKDCLIMDKNVINNAISKLESTKVDLYLPRLSIKAKYILNTPLKELGIIDAFRPNADFGKISSEYMQISEVIHVTMVDMDEFGLVAAAAAAIGMSKGFNFDPDKPVTFRADHSFQLCIVDGSAASTKGDTILFMGQINDPNGQTRRRLKPRHQAR